MRDFRWRARSRRTRTQPLLALPGWVGTAFLVVLVLISCTLAGSYVMPQAAALLQQDMTAARTALPATETVAPTRTRPPATNTRAPAATVAATQAIVAPTVAPTEVAVPTETPAATAVSAAIAVGSTVEVVGTSGIGLSLRAGPSVQDPLVRVARESERLVVVEGPVEADGYTWWKLHNDLGEDGWGADSFLNAVTP